MNLDHIQKSMCESIIQRRADESITSIFKTYPQNETHERLSVYRNNTYHSLIEAIKDLYPTVTLTVGEQFITTAARDFLQNHPPDSAAMVDFGQSFPEFLTLIGQQHKVPYLADIARFDLLHHQSYHALDEPSVQGEAFTEFGIESLASAKIRPLASAKMLSSAFAVFDIWQLANQNIDQEINANTAQSALIIRPEADVDIYRLDKGLFCFFERLIYGDTVYQSLEQASEQDEAFNPTQAISFLIQSGFTASIIGEQS